MRLFLPLTLLLFTAQVFSQTYISGAISSNTTWKASNSPYIITDDTVVFENSTLNVEPGVIVKFEDNAQLRIQGRLIAQGSKTQNILFTSNSPSPQKGSWKEIFFEFRATFILNYVKIEYAENALNYEFVNNSSIKNSTFSDNKNGISVNSGGPQWAVTIESTKFIDNGKGISGFHDEVTLKYCEFINNVIGAELTESNIDSCLFEGNFLIGVDARMTKVQNSTFLKNGIGLNQSLNYDSNYPTIVTGNTIKENNIGIKVLSFSNGSIVSNNTICNNKRYNVENASTRAAYFSDNCWCSTDINEIENTIYDGNDNINYGLVNFKPIASGCPDTTIDVPPTLENQSVSIYEDSYAFISLSAVDQDSNIFTYAINTPPANGRATIQNNRVIYTPNSNFNGVDNFTVTANDGQFISEPAEINVTIRAVNDPPLANIDYINVNEGESTKILINNESSLLANDTDIEINELKAILVSNPEHGKLQLNLDGTFDYKHDGSGHISDSFTYRTSDGELVSNTTSVIISINPKNDHTPSNIILSDSLILENQFQTRPWMLQVVDVDVPSDKHVFQLIEGLGDTNNTDFEIKGNYLSTIRTFDYETENTLSVRIKVTDAHNTSLEKIFKFNVIDKNDISLSYDLTHSYCFGSEGTGSISITDVQNVTGDLRFTWSATNGGIIPNGEENNQTIANLTNGTYHLTLSDSKYTFKKSFEVNSIPPYNQLSICYVSSDDTVKTKNRIHFNNKGNYNVAFYEILRESNLSDVYVSIGTVQSNENSFLDDTSNNTTQPYNYKIRSIDNCGNISANSDLHRTILLQSSVAIDGTVNLNWSDYKGTSFETYNIYRKTNQESFKIISSVSGNIHSFNDTSAEIRNNSYEYFISVPILDCLVESAKTQKNTKELKSNYQIIESLIRPLEDSNDGNKNPTVYPIPARNNINVRLNSNESYIKSTIFNVFGIKLFETSESDISIEHLPAASYFIQVETSQGTSTTKILKR